MLYLYTDTASVAKWLRQWIVVPPFVGSSPIVRPYMFCLYDGAFTPRMAETIPYLAQVTPKSYPLSHYSHIPKRVVNGLYQLFISQ